MTNTMTNKSQQGSKEIVSLADKAARLDSAAQEYSVALTREASPFTSALILSQGIQALRDLLDDEIMDQIMPLADTPLGFLTDKKTKGGYKPAEIKDAVIEATLRGFKVVGNEFNIIASRFYAAQAGLHRKVLTHPGVTNFKESFSVPKVIGDKGATLNMKATWMKDGVQKELTRDIAIKGDQYASVDSYIGKARRKLYAAVLNELQGISTPEGEVTDDSIPVQSEVVTEEPAPVEHQPGILSEVTATGSMYSATFNIPQLKRVLQVWTADEVVGEQMKEFEEGDVIAELKPDKKGDGFQVISVKLARPDDAGKGKDQLL